MRRLFFAVIAVMFLTAMFVPVLLSESADTEDGTVIGGTGDTIITATVVAIPDIEPTAVVNIYVDDVKVLYTYTAGEYVFTVSGDIADEVSIRFEVIGYAVVGYVHGVVYCDPDATGALDVILPASSDLVVIIHENPEVPTDTEITATVVAIPEIDPSTAVNIYVDDKQLVRNTDFTVDTDGNYVFTVSGDPGDSISIRFEVIGYAAIGYVYGGVYYEPDETGTLDIILPASSNLVVIMQEKKEKISGTVRWRNGSPVGGGVLVQAYDQDSGIIYTARTDGNGKYELKCPVNVVYTVSISHPVYEAEPYNMTEKLTGPITNIDFILTPKDSATYLFGFDLTHSLMVIGGMGGLFLLIFVMLYRIHISKHPERSRVHSDSKKKDQD